MRERFERFDKYMKMTGLNDNQVTLSCGLSQGLLGQARAGKSDLGPKTIEKILNVYQDINRVWLLTGEGDMLNPPPLDNSNGDSKRINSRNSVPLIPVPALANSLAEYIGEGFHLERCERVISPIPGAEYAIQISGDSMEPKFQDGAYIFIKKINEAAFIPWGNPLLVDTENGVFLKVVFPCTGDDSLIEARSFNTYYPPLLIPKDSIRGMYRVLGTAKIFSTM